MKSNSISVNGPLLQYVISSPDSGLLFARCAGIGA